MRALVTGADGFVGRWLIRHLTSSGDDVFCALGPKAQASDVERARPLDVRDSHAVEEVCRWAAPEAIYHLAAVAFGPDVERSAAEATAITVTGTVNLLEAAQRLNPTPTVLVSGSAEVYARPEAGEALTERHPIAPSSLYGGSKAAQEALALAYHRAGRVQTAVTRSFNHIGPGQREDFVVASLASQLARAALPGAERVVRVGNLAAERDFTDVRDVVRAYRLLVVGGHTGEPFNVASGRAVRIEEILWRLRAISGLDVEVKVDTGRLRAAEATRIVGDASRLQALTGWRPGIRLDTTLGEVWTDACSRAGVSA